MSSTAWPGRGERHLRHRRRAAAAVATVVVLAGCGTPGAPSEGSNAVSVDEASLRQAIVARAAELGADIQAGDVRLTYLPDGTVPGYQIFRGIYSYRDMRDAVTGIVGGDEQPDTHPHRALGKVFARWTESGGLPDPVATAEAVAFLIGGAGPYQVIASEEDLAALAPQVREHVALPAHTEVGGQPGVEFWWEKGIGVVKVAIHLAGPEEVELIQRTLQEVVGGD